MRNRFDEELENLNVEMIKMGSLCEDAISISIIALLNDDEALYEKVFRIEEEIDKKERDIEAICMKLLLRQQPVAKDFRVISAALKMITDMERIGDQASDITEIAKYLKHNGVKNRIQLKEMAEAASKMVTESIDSFVKRDMPLAKKVINDDDIVDELFDSVKKELTDLISEDSANGEFCLDLLMIAKYLERIGDHATNIAEWVEYMITGVHISYN